MNHNTRLAIFHRELNCADNPGVMVSGQNQLLRFAMNNKASADRIIGPLNKRTDNFKDSSKKEYRISYQKTLIAIPKEWSCQTNRKKSNILCYDKDLSIPKKFSQHKKNSWLIITNARFVSRINYNWLFGILYKLRADVIAVNITPQLKAGHNKILVTKDNKIVGFRRYYEDTVEQTPHHNDWPELLFIKTCIQPKVLISGKLCLSFGSFVDKCRSNLLCFRNIKVAGDVMDLDSREGLLGYLNNCTSSRKLSRNHYFNDEKFNGTKIKIADKAILTGKVFLGQNVKIGRNSMIVGPAFIGDNVIVEQDAVIKQSIIGPRINIKSKQVVDNQIVIDGDVDCLKTQTNKSGLFSPSTASVNSYNGDSQSARNGYRVWPKLSYARFLKRVFDIIAAIIVLNLFAPILLIVALIVKLNSSGPVFFKDKRQGMHGKTFKCLKFRTMMPGADAIQSKLRSENQVDGPQFKMDNDPRVNKIGGFLRDTYLDEIPQFFNVLAGQMSIVGPRPSPASENTLCAHWRDARLSVRPGITGLWQVCRSRKPMKDFQEWIYYDTKYVRNVSLKLDIWICWKTFKQMVMKFIRKF